jgi:anti-sigma B factor antagonist
MNFHAEHHGRIAVLRLPERLMLANAPDLRSDLLQQVDAGDPQIVLDLSDVAFADSSGLSAVLACVTAARRAGGDVALASPSPRVRALIELTRLDEVIRVFPNVAESLAHLHAEAA